MDAAALPAAFEARILALAGLLAVVQLLHAAVLANLQVGTEYLAGPRDEPRALTGRPARWKRAFENHVEGLVLFGAAVAAVALTGSSSGLTEGAAAVYLAARVVYPPLYGFGLAPWRTVAWAAGFFATLTMLVAAAF